MQANNQVKVVSKGTKKSKHEGLAGLVIAVDEQAQTATVKLDLADDPVDIKIEDLLVLC